MMIIFMIIICYNSELVDVETCPYPNISMSLEHTFICTITTFIRMENTEFRTSNYFGT